MNYVGFLCLGLGIFTLVGGMLFSLVTWMSKEPIIKLKTKKFAIVLLPIAILLLTVGLKLTSPMLTAS